MDSFSGPYAPTFVAVNTKEIIPKKVTIFSGYCSRTLKQLVIKQFILDGNDQAFETEIKVRQALSTQAPECFSTFKTNLSALNFINKVEGVPNIISFDTTDQYCEIVMESPGQTL